MDTAPPSSWFTRVYPAIADKAVITITDGEIKPERIAASPMISPPTTERV